VGEPSGPRLGRKKKRNQTLNLNLRGLEGVLPINSNRAGYNVILVEDHILRVFVLSWVVTTGVTYVVWRGIFQRIVLAAEE